MSSSARKVSLRAGFGTIRRSLNRFRNFRHDGWWRRGRFVGDSGLFAGHGSFASKWLVRLSFWFGMAVFVFGTGFDSQTA